MLARDLNRTVDEMRRSLSTEEYTQWIAFYNWEQKRREKIEREQRRSR